MRKWGLAGNSGKGRPSNSADGNTPTNKRGRKPTTPSKFAAIATDALAAIAAAQDGGGNENTGEVDQSEEDNLNSKTEYQDEDVLESVTPAKRIKLENS